MARRPRFFAPGVLYHVIVRGNHQQKTFFSSQDYEVYNDRLARYRNKFHVSLHAFCLMPNHVHLLLVCAEEPLSKFMQGIQQSYTQYFNRTYKKVGHLFQGRYKAIICDKDEYLLALVRYIHLNPVRSKLVERPEQYKYSGHCVFLKGKPTNVVDPTFVLKVMGGRKSYERFVLDGLREGHKEAYYELRDQQILGADEFARELKKETRGTYEAQEKKPIGKVLELVAQRIRVDPQVLRGPDRSWQVSKKRTLLVYVLIRRLGFGVGEVADYLRRDPTTLTTLVSRLSNRTQREQALREEIESLARIV